MATSSILVNIFKEIYTDYNIKDLFSSVRYEQMGDQTFISYCGMFGNPFLAGISNHPEHPRIVIPAIKIIVWED